MWSRLCGTGSEVLTLSLDGTNAVDAGLRASHVVTPSSADKFAHQMDQSGEDTPQQTHGFLASGSASSLMVSCVALPCKSADSNG
jgi:hypothetical protein